MSLLRASRRAFGAPQHEARFLMALKNSLVLKRSPLRDAACGGASGQGSLPEGCTALVQSIVVGFALIAFAALSPTPAAAEERQCVRTENILWGDGRHDDTVALNAWLKGENAVWGDTGRSVGAAIAGRVFRLSSAIYVVGGTGRVLQDFRLIFPERSEVVIGGMVRAGEDPNQPPVSTGVTITGGDSGEGVPFDAPDLSPARAEDKAACPIS